MLVVFGFHGFDDDLAFLMQDLGINLRSDLRILGKMSTQAYYARERSGQAKRLSAALALRNELVYNFIHSNFSEGGRPQRCL